MFLYSRNMTGDGAELLEVTPQCNARFADEAPINSGKNEIDLYRRRIIASFRSKRFWRGVMLVGSGPKNEDTAIAPV